MGRIFESITSNAQAIEISMARSNRELRRMDRILQRHLKFVENGYDYSRYKIVSNWLTDLLIYWLDLVWAYIWPILFNVFFTFITLALIVLANIIFFGGILMYLANS